MNTEGLIWLTVAIVVGIGLPWIIVRTLRGGESTDGEP